MRSGCTSSRPGSSGRPRSTRAAGQGPREDRPGGGGHPGARFEPTPDMLACTYCPFPRHLPGERGPVTDSSTEPWVAAAPGDQLRLRQHARPGPARGLARGRHPDDDRHRRDAPARSVTARSRRPGSRRASASSRRTSRGCGRSTSPNGPSGSSPGCAACRPPESTSRWDDRQAATYSEPDEVASRSSRTAGRSSRRSSLHRRSVRCSNASPGGYALAICSNWPLGSTLDRFVDAAGWARLPCGGRRLAAGRTIKPDPRIFRAAEAALGLPADTILHVGDDWSADVVGGRRAGWRVAYLATGQPDSPFPASQPSDDVEPDLRLERLADLEVALAIAPR